MSNEVIAGLFALGGVALGWVLGEASGWIKAKRRSRVLKRALLAEISDARGWLNRTRLVVESAMQLALYRVLLTVGPIKFRPHIYTAHFAEASLHLTESDRISFNAIYHLVDTVNGLTDQLQLRIEGVAKALTLPADKGAIEQAFREMAGTLELIYSNARHAVYNINYHLKNQKNLDMFAQSPDEARKLDEEIRTG